MEILIQLKSKPLSFHLEKNLNEQLKEEFKAAHFYKNCYAFYSKPQIYLPGLAAYFKAAFQEEEKHAQMIIDYINLRNGTVIIPELDAPLPVKDGSYETALNTFKDTLILEEGLTLFITNLHNDADEAKDVHLSSYLEDTFIPEQYKAVSEVRGLLCKLERMGPGLGYQKFDDMLLQGKQIV